MNAVLQALSRWAEKHITHRLANSPEFQRFVATSNATLKKSFEKSQQQINDLRQRAQQQQQQQRHTHYPQANHHSSAKPPPAMDENPELNNLPLLNRVIFKILKKFM